jgi:hypothetical protein
MAADRMLTSSPLGLKAKLMTSLRSSRSEVSKMRVPAVPLEDLHVEASVKAQLCQRRPCIWCLALL